MALAWGNSWGLAWGNSWGAIAPVVPSPIYQQIWIIEGKPKKRLLRKQRKIRDLAAKLEEDLKTAAKAVKAKKVSPAQAKQIQLIVEAQVSALSLSYDKLGEELGVLQEALEAKGKALERVANAWKRIQREIQKQEDAQRLNELDELETLYLLMVTL